MEENLAEIGYCVTCGKPVYQNARGEAVHDCPACKEGTVDCIPRDRFSRFPDSVITRYKVSFKRRSRYDILKES